MICSTKQLFGLTGGIGCGKTTVATILAECGAHVIDTDLIARKLTAPGGPGIAPIEAAFGTEMISPDGAMNRTAMRELVFRTPEAKKRLEDILHPLIAKCVSDAIASAPDCALVLDIPLLVESPRWRKRLSNVIVVDCPVNIQIERVARRNGWSMETIMSIIHSQTTRSSRLDAADTVIFNHQLSLDNLREEIRALAVQLGI